jgi:Guanine nucleotide exchange factor synembryn
MDFPIKLRDVLFNKEESVSTSERRSKLIVCSGDIEAHFDNPNRDSHEHCDPQLISRDLLPAVAAALQKAILVSLVSEATEITDSHQEQVTQSIIRQLKQRCITRESNPSKLQLTGELLRATKNLFRWYIQILSVPSRPPSFPSHLECLQSNGMLEIYFTLIQHTQGDASNEITQQVAKTATLALFYATLPSLQTENTTGNAYLEESLDFSKTMLRMLIQYNTSPVLLTFIRILHSALGSGAVQKVLHCHIPFQVGPAPWAPTSESEYISFRVVLFRILHWSFTSSLSSPSQGLDRRIDLAIEILQVLYILQVGKDLALPELQVITLLLYLPNENEGNFQVKLACVTVLMDSSSTLATFFLENGIGELLKVLEIQVSYVLDHTTLGDQAVTALMPILVVLRTFSLGNNDFLLKLKEQVFPPELEDNFWKKAQQETLAHGKARNATPLDAPKGTLRWKLVRLLTWTESHVKRLASELMLTLCGNDDTEFVLRLGYGNVMPMLGLRGLVP